MEKLELKHLAPYLPYGLKYDLPDMVNGGRTIEVMDWDNIMDVIVVDDYKPILRPLSDLTKEVEIDGEIFVPQSNLSYISKDYLRWFSAEDMLSDVPYNDIQLLLEWHFDVFGLIEKCLAIDINTLEQ